VRVVCPPHDTGSVIGLLRAEPGAAHLVVIPGVASQPPGDVVEAEIARESAGAILGRLTERGIARPARSACTPSTPWNRMPPRPLNAPPSPPSPRTGPGAAKPSSSCSSTSPASPWPVR
jgi:hypothetical protein